MTLKLNNGNHEIVGVSNRKGEIGIVWCENCKNDQPIFTSGSGLLIKCGGCDNNFDRNVTEIKWMPKDDLNKIGWNISGRE